MTRVIRTTVLLGDLVAAAFDQAASVSSDPPEISHRAVRSVHELMRQTQHRLQQRPLGAAFAVAPPRDPGR